MSHRGPGIERLFRCAVTTLMSSQAPGIERLFGCSSLFFMFLLSSCFWCFLLPFCWVDRMTDSLCDGMNGSNDQS
jgi:hypothetical protein